MTEEKIKRMLDACFLAKRIRDFLPELPDGVKPAYIQYMDTIHKLQGNGVQRVKISDIRIPLQYHVRVLQGRSKRWKKGVI